MRQRIIEKAQRLHLPRRTVRLRLTMLYGGLLLASGAVLLVITGFLWGGATEGAITFSSAVPKQIVTIAGGSRATVSTNWRQVVQGKTAVHASTLVGARLRDLVQQQHNSDLHQLLLYSGIALGIMAMLAAVLGWLVAGRVLRPLRTITSAARDISVTNLHERLGLRGPDDELKELGDTFDGLLARLDGSFRSQRQFVANASHELRTPLATMRASLDVAIAKPGPISEQMIILDGRLREELDHVDRLLEGLLALARVQAVPDTDQLTLPLDDIVAAALARRSGAISQMDLDVDHEVSADTAVVGNEVLLSRMVENVIDNAVTHNERGGWIRATTEVEGARVLLIVENGGRILDEDDMEELAQPFRRLGTERTGPGTGLGLSIVAAVAEAHGGRLELHALSGGGFQAIVDLPLAVRTLTGAPA